MASLTQARAAKRQLLREVSDIEADAIGITHVVGGYGLTVAVTRRQRAQLPNEIDGVPVSAAKSNELSDIGVATIVIVIGLVGVGLSLLLKSVLFFLLSFLVLLGGVAALVVTGWRSLRGHAGQ